MSIGERILQLRKEAKISQGQLASLLDVSRQAVSKWENDLAEPDTLRLIQLADVLDTDVEYLACGKIRNNSSAFNSKEIPVQEKIVEKIVEKPVIKYVDREIQKIVEIEKPVERVVLKRIMRIRYLRNPIEFGIVGVVCFLAGIIVGVIL